MKLNLGYEYFLKWDKNLKKDENNEKRSLILKVVEISYYCIIEWNVGWSRFVFIRGFMK